MKISTLLAASVIAAIVVASPLVSSAQHHWTQVTQFRSTSEVATGVMYTGNVAAAFYANAYDDNNGVPQGDIWVSWSDYNTYPVTYSHISCSGTAYANVVSVNQGNGNSSINATLNPASPDCYSSYNLSSPVTVNLSGQYNGSYTSHDTGTGNSTALGTRFQYNVQHDFFSETFTGTNGFATGTFDGAAYTEHRTQLQKQ